MNVLISCSMIRVKLVCTFFVLLSVWFPCIAATEPSSVNVSLASWNETLPAGRDNDIGRGQLGTAHLVINYLIFFVSGTIAAAAGVGGGAIYTPLIIILYDLLYEAVPLSKAAVFGCSLAFFAGNLHSKSQASQPGGFQHRFAYDVIMIMEPATLLGTAFGVLVSRIIPYWLITILMVALLSFSARKTFQKGKRLRDVEESPEESQWLMNDGKLSRVPTGYGTTQAATKTIVMTECDGYESWIGYRCITSVAISYVCVLLSSILTDDSSPIGISCGSAAYWSVIVTSSCICLIVTLSNVAYLLRRRRKIVAMNRSIAAHELEEYSDKSVAVVWTVKNCLIYPALCVVAGFLSSLVGVGGSTIKTPILLQMGLHPALAKSTGQLMLLSTVSGSLFQFWFNGMLPVEYAFTFFVSGILSGVVGKYSIDTYVRHKGRSSLIVYLLAWYIVVAMITMAGIGVLLVIGQLFGPTMDHYKHRTEQLWFRSMCNSLPPDMGAIKWLFT